MEDPVAVFGRSDIVSMYLPAYRPTNLDKLELDRQTYVNIPGTECHINEVNTPPDEYQNIVNIVHNIDRPMRAIRICNDHRRRYEGYVMASMVLERQHLVGMIDRCIAALQKEAFLENTEIHPVHVTLENWKKELVIERIRRSMSARTVQRQFRESMSNPAYVMCKRRLLREFKNLNDSIED